MHIDEIPELKEFDIGNGRCKFLLDTNLCLIYDARPDICNVDRMYELIYRSYMSREEYDKKNMEGCKIVKKIWG